MHRLELENACFGPKGHSKFLSRWNDQIWVLGQSLWRASLVAQSVKNLPAMQKVQVQSLSREDPGEDVNPLQYSCLGNPMDGGSWWSTVHRVAKSQTQLSNFTHSLGCLSNKQPPNVYLIHCYHKWNGCKEWDAAPDFKSVNLLQDDKHKSFGSMLHDRKELFVVFSFPRVSLK